MTESIAEMVLPNTYIEVRAEGLIAAGAISTGNLGVVGTAARGPRNQVVLIGSYSEALDHFGSYDALASPATSGAPPLTLTRTLEKAFSGGAGNVFAVRIANGDTAAAHLDIPRDTTGTSFTLTAVDGGTWANAIQGGLASVGPPATPAFELTLTYGRTRETFTGADATALRADVAAHSLLVTAGPVGNGSTGLGQISPAAPFAGGTDSPAVTSIDVADGLAALVDQPVNILLVGGLGATQTAAVVQAHLGTTLEAGAERLAVLGATASGTAADPSPVVTEVGSVSNDRVILVAPGVQTTDIDGAAITLTPPYLAAVVAGRLSTLAPQVSLTNKTLPIDGLDVKYSTTALEALLQDRVLLVRKRLGFQVVKGITTDAGPFRQISVRRVVDYAKTGVRSGADPYIGRLNNARVRAALQATLDGFLSQMVLDEMLIGYTLTVSATRSQEIQGICSVVMTLQPTFSIDFIRVTMNLQ